MTTRFSLRPPQRQARLVALAVAYHLARPGSELDHDTMRDYEHGLADAPAKRHGVVYCLFGRLTRDLRK